MVDIHGLVSNRSSLDQNVLGIKMSYANLPASMGKPRADLEWTLPREQSSFPADRTGRINGILILEKFEPTEAPPRSYPS